uniref:Uncharacterized protein n=1 Tax=Otus sunia TaxID=257818 RepID=A0A8C8ASI6_9STRI
HSGTNSKLVYNMHLPRYLLTYQHKAMSATHKFQHVPVKHIVIGEPLSIRIVRFVIKTQRTAEIQVCGKFSCNKRKPVFSFSFTFAFLNSESQKKKKITNHPKPNKQGIS